jgi:hypothetical protein
MGITASEILAGTSTIQEKQGIDLIIRIVFYYDKLFRISTISTPLIELN